MPNDKDPDFYPESLEDDLPNFEGQSWGDIENEKQMREAFRRAFENKRKIFDETPADIDVRVEVYHYTDRVGHKSDKLEQILDAYEKTDEVLGDRMEEYDDILLVSDHGFQHVEEYFYINTWLKNNDYLEEEEQKVSKLTKLVQAIATPLTKTSLKPFIRRAHKIVKSGTGMDFGVSSPSVEDIDFKNTKVFSYRGGSIDYADINIHDLSYPEGVVEDKEALKEELRNKLEQEEKIEQVWDAEEIYDSMERMPDLVVKTTPNVGVGMSLLPSETMGTDGFIHSDTGIVAAYGDNFSKGEIKNAELVDIAPTIARYIGQNLEEVDGTSLDVFKEEFEPKKPTTNDLLNDIDI
jgi:predicted AlkP superfamily phosphohydrolase/phosphomutase